MSPPLGAPAKDRYRTRTSLGLVQGIEHDRVTDWLTANIEGAVAPFTFDQIEGGRSNLTYRVTDAEDRSMVLRRPPLGNVLATAHDMSREHRIVTAVGKTDVPVPTTLGLCEDDAVNGAPFYVMDFVDGAVLGATESAELIDEDERRSLSEHLVDVLADLHSADIDAIGLGELARREGYVERQVKRWSKQWAQSKTRDLPVVDEVATLLAADMPDQQGAVVAHGDFRFGNCIVDTDTARVVAVLDWELCTLGDPLADLGYLGVYWGGDDRSNDPSSAPGFPTYAEMVERYAKRTGRDVSRIDYYVAFSSFRLAVISEGVYARYLHGAMGEGTDQAVLDMFSAATEELSNTALDLLTGKRSIG